MALENSDVFVVQKQASGEVRKITAQQLDTYLQAGDSVVYKGTGDFTDLGDNPAIKQVGDLYINDALNAGTFAWLPDPGTVTVNPGDQCIYDGAKWDIIPSGGGAGVSEIEGTTPIEVNSDDAAKPIVSITPATTAAFGAVQLATNTDVTNSATNRVVTADQLKSVKDDVDNAVAGGVSSVTGADPIESSGGLDIYEMPQKDHEYLMTVDVSRGMKLDYSAFLVFDITAYPHKLVGKYRNNEIKPMLFPDIIVQVAKQFNNAWILCEVNDIGDQVASIIFYDMEYENLLMTSMRGRAGQVLGMGFSGGKTQLGLKMAKAPKKLGCSNMKQMVESDKVIFKDFQIINELTTFVEKKSSFEAEDGCHDDLVMCLVMYAWAVAQDYFVEMTDQNVREELYEKDKRQLEEDMSPFGFIVNGTEDEVIVEKDKNLVWRMVDDESLVERYRDRVTDYDLASIDSTYGLPSSDWEWQ